MNIVVKLREGKHASQCLITDVEPSELGYVDPLKSAVFSLLLFPKICGVANISGLVVYDLLNKK